MKKIALLILLLVPVFALAEVDNTIHVDQFPGATVGAKVTAAMATCTTNVSIPCILVIDPSLAVWAPGTLPTLCSHCSIADFRQGIQGGGASVNGQPISPSSVQVGSTFITSGQEIDVACNGNITANLQAAINALGSSGGVVKLSTGSCYDTAQIADSSIVSLHIMGNGSQASQLVSPLNAASGTLLDMRYSGGPKIYATGTGRLEIDHIGFEDTTDGTQPFIYTSNTVIDIHNNSFQGKNSACCVVSPALPTQDGIELGGPGASPLFQGYPAIIRDNQFAGIRNIILGGSEANSIIFEGNTGTVLDGGACAVQFGTSGGQSQGAIFRDNLIEMPNYNYGMCLTEINQSWFSANSFWDTNAGTISAATNANPVVLNYASSESGPLLAGDKVTISGFTGNWAPLNGVQTVTAATGTTFTLAINTTSFGAVTGSGAWGLYMGAYYADSATSNNFYSAGYHDDVGGQMVLGPGANPDLNTIVDIDQGGVQKTDAIVGQSSTLTPGTMTIYSNTGQTNPFAALLALEQQGGGTYAVGTDFGSLYFALNPSCTTTYSPLVPVAGIPHCTPAQLAAAAILTMSASGVTSSVPFNAPNFALGSGTAQSAGLSLTTQGFPTYGNEIAFLQPGAANIIEYQNANILYFSVNPSCTYPLCTPSQAAAASVFTLNAGGTSTVMTPFSVDSGTSTIYRCTTAGTLPIGALTSVSGNCGASVDSGLRTN